MLTKLKHKLTSLADLIEKVFCPTGPGGGVDPTCSRGGGRSGGEGDLSSDDLSSIVDAAESSEAAVEDSVQDAYVFSDFIGVTQGVANAGKYAAENAKNTGDAVDEVVYIAREFARESANGFLGDSARTLSRKIDNLSNTAEEFAIRSSRASQAAADAARDAADTADTSTRAADARAVRAARNAADVASNAANDAARVAEVCHAIARAAESEGKRKVSK